MKVAGLGVGVSVVCPGWVRTSIYQAKRNWPGSLGEVPPSAATAEIVSPHVQRVIDEGMVPAAVADLVADAIAADRFWVFTDPISRRGRSTGGSASPKAKTPRLSSTYPASRQPRSSPRRSGGC